MDTKECFFTKGITSLDQIKKGARLLNKSGSDEVLVVAINLGGVVITESESHGETAIWSLRELQEHGILLIGKEPLNRDEAEVAMRDGKIVVNLEMGIEYKVRDERMYAFAHGIFFLAESIFGLPPGRYEIVEAE